MPCSSCLLSAFFLVGRRGFWRAAPLLPLTIFVGCAGTSVSWCKRLSPWRLHFPRAANGCCCPRPSSRCRGFGRQRWFVQRACRAERVRCCGSLAWLGACCGTLSRRQRGEVPAARVFSLTVLRNRCVSVPGPQQQVHLPHPSQHGQDRAEAAAHESV